MLFRERAVGKDSLTTVLLLLAAWLFACCSATTLEHGSVSRAVSIRRFAVAFSKQQKHQVQQQILRDGYQITFEGPGFFAVTHRSPLVPVSSSWSSGARRRLIEQLQRAGNEHLERLSSIPGVSSSEHDVRRFLHLRPTPASLHNNNAARQLSSSTAAAHLSAAAGLANRIRQAGLIQPNRSSTRRQLGQLAGHWHQADVKLSQFKPGPYDIWGNSVGDQKCASQDIQLGDYAGAETVPWGIQRIGAWNSTIRKAPPKGKVVVCVIDSGISTQHPEYRSTAPGIHDNLDGCKVSANCPFIWSQDIVGHGTHVSGTIGAPQNGLGVVGAISNGADLLEVRIWNDTGDVSQGQGPYATDLILAYDQCLAHLKDLQKKEKNAKMVINMSYGSAGPLTVERLWIRKVAKRGDVLFVGSAGNNGSWYRGADSSRGQADQGQYFSYPASYDIPEMISVANARCDNTIDFTSQKNKRVNIAAPGMAILSSVPQEYGAVRAYITTSKPLPNQTEPNKPAQSSTSSTGLPFNTLGLGGASIAAPGQTRRGLGFLPNGYREPRAVQGSQVGSSGMLPLVPCNISGTSNHFSEYGYAKLPTEEAQKRQQSLQTQLQQPGCKGVSGAVCLTRLPGEVDWYKETCLAMLNCMRGGGKGVVMWRKDQLMDGIFSSRGSDYQDGNVQPDELLLGTQVNCGSNCPCWGELRKLLSCDDSDACAKKMAPAIIVSSQHAQALYAAVAPSKTTSSGVVDSRSSLLRVNVTNYDYPYRHYDGTSMAAPHVSGAAALLWRLFPNCAASVISEALHKSAEKLADDSIAEGSGLLRVDRAYDWMQRNKNCAKR